MGPVVLVYGTVKLKGNIECVLSLYRVVWELCMPQLPTINQILLASIPVGFQREKEVCNRTRIGKIYKYCTG